MRKLASFLFVAVAAPVVALNCSPYSPDLGESPYLCAATAPECPEDYTCETDGTGRRVCVSEGGVAPDAGSGSDTFQCNDDSSLGNNDTTATAYVTSVDSRSELTLAGLAICPETDRDHFEINISQANRNLEVTTRWDSGTTPVAVQILNAGGTSIKNGIQLGTNAIQACVPNLPIGRYYAATFTGGKKQNYKLEIKIVAACQ